MAPSGTHALGVATARATVDEISAEGTTLPVQGFSMEIAGNFKPRVREYELQQRGQRDLVPEVFAARVRLASIAFVA